MHSISIKQLRQNSILVRHSQFCDIFECKVQQPPILLYCVLAVSDSNGRKAATDSFCRVCESLDVLSPHPIIEHFYGYDLTELSFVTEHINIYRNLATIVSPESEIHLSPTQKSIIAYSLICGILHFHSADICHRLIDPETICIDDNFIPRITSFFRSRVSKDKSKSFEPSPYLIFDAPEKISEGVIGKEVDIYAYGMILYLLLYDRIPYFGKEPLPTDVRSPSQQMPGAPRNRYQNPISGYNNQMHLFDKIIKGDRPLFTDKVDEDQKGETEDLPIAKLIKKCWDGRPENRPTAADIVIILDSSDPLFPGTDEEVYRSKCQEIFAKTVCKEEEKIRFTKKSRDAFKQLYEQVKSPKPTAKQFFELGKLYYKGIGCPKSETEARIYCEKALKAGSLGANYFLGKVIEYHKDPKKALEYLETLHEHHFLRAYTDLSRLYANKYKELSLTEEEGFSKAIEIHREFLDLIPHNQKVFLELYPDEKQRNRELCTIKIHLSNDLRKYAKIKYQDDQANFNKLYTEAKGLLLDVIKYEEVDAKKRKIHPFAKTASLLYDIYLHFNQEEEGVQLLRKYNRSDPVAANLYKYGSYLEKQKDYLKALRYYEQAISKDSIKALYYAANLYENLDKYCPIDSSIKINTENFTPDYERAAELYEQCANIDTEYVPADYHKEIRISQYKMGQLLLEGKGVFQSYQSAMTYFNESLKGPYRVPTLVEIGYIYMERRAIDGEKVLGKSIPEAKRHLDMAIKEGTENPSPENDMAVKRAKELLQQINQQPKRRN